MNTNSSTVAPHLCPLHIREQGALLFVCLTEACFSQGMLCFHCGAKHAGGSHNIKSLDQLKKEAVNMAYDKSASDNVQELFKLAKAGRQRCLTSIREARTILIGSLEEA